MSITIIKKVKNFAEYYPTPFTAKTIMAQLDLSETQAKRILTKLHSRKVLKAISKEHKWNIYIKNPEYKEEPTTNQYGFDLNIMRKLIKMVRKGNCYSIRQIRKRTGHSRNFIARYLTALASSNIITIRNGFYLLIKENPNFLTVGKTIKNNIIFELRDKDKGLESGMRRKILIDANGEEYPAYELDSHIIKQDTFVKKLISKAIRLQDRIEADKKKINSEIQKYIKKTQKANDGEESNLELISFDGRHKVEIKNKITFYRRTSSDQPFEEMSLNFDDI